MAIPVNLLDRFLARPDVTFTAEGTEAVNVDAPVEFKASVRSLIPTRTRSLCNSFLPPVLPPVPGPGETVGRILPSPCSAVPAASDR